MDTAEASLGGERMVAGHPQGRKVGDGAAGAHGAQRMVGVMHPFAVPGIFIAVHKMVQHAQHLALQRGEGLGGLGLHQVLVQGNHDLGQRQHEIRQGRGHVPDKAGRGGVDGLGDELVQQELGLLRHEYGFFRDARVGEVFFHIPHFPLQGHDVVLQEAGQVPGNILIQTAQRRIRGLRDREDPVHRLQAGLRGFSLAAHDCSGSG